MKLLIGAIFLLLALARIFVILIDEYKQYQPTDYERRD